ncbi:hypothetical protein PIB30_054127 [Stylosanthes scabra]|uniref:Uncharacterized protein n=1 Tax=Stylosanthes scabra TaxID=79078 RepID=A0ABU6WLG5_9FABA|nr:hypothetical protein [Stylosanthes scabra]
MMQDTTSPPAQVPPPAVSTLPAQPSQNLKSDINALQHEKKKRGIDIGDIGKRRYTLYNLIAQLADSDDEESEVESEGGYSDESGEDRVGGEEENEEDSEEDDDESEEEEENGNWLYDLLVELYEAQEKEKESDDSQAEEESDVDDEIEEVETDNEADKTFFIATLFNNKRVKEEIPAKCEDPGPCLVTFLGTWTTKKTEEIFTNADASVVSVVGIAKDVNVRIGGLIIHADFHVIKPGKKDNGGTPQVLLGRPFLKSGGFKLNYHDEIFTFEVGNTIEIFHFDNCSEPEKKGLRQLKTNKKKKKEKKIAKKRRKRKEEEADKKNRELKSPTAKSKKDKKKKALSTLEKRKGIRKTEGSNPKKKKIEGGKIRRNRKKKKREKAKEEKDEARIKCSSLSELFRKLKELKRCLRQKKGADAHLVKNNSKWK